MLELIPVNILHINQLTGVDTSSNLPACLRSIRASKPDKIHDIAIIWVLSPKNRDLGVVAVQKFEVGGALGPHG